MIEMILLFIMYYPQAGKPRETWLGDQKQLGSNFVFRRNKRVLQKKIRSVI